MNPAVQLANQMVAEAEKRMDRAGIPKPGIYGRLDLFAGERCYSAGGAREFRLCAGLSDAQRQEALAIVQVDYPYGGYLTSLDGDRIKVGSAD
jgi:hypothetical protein